MPVGRDVLFFMQIYQFMGEILYTGTSNSITGNNGLKLK